VRRDGYPVFVSPTELTYWAVRGIKYYRFPFSWSQANLTFGTTGIQPIAYGPLDTTATHYPLQGTNRLFNSDLPTAAPWSTYAPSGSMTVTPNVATDSNGFPAHLLSAVRPDGTTYQVFEAGPYGWNRSQYVGARLHGGDAR